MTRTLTAAAIASALLLTGPASAQSCYLVFVPHGDLDLATDAGERKLDARLRAAARQTCGSAAVRLNERKMMRDCQASFRDAGRPKVAAILAARSDRGMVMAAR